MLLSVGSYSTGMVSSALLAHWHRSSVWAPQSSSLAPESKSHCPRQPPSTYFWLKGRHAAGPSQRFQSTTSGGGVFCAASHVLSSTGTYTEACSVCSLPSLPECASATAFWKFGTLRRWVPAWNTRFSRRIVSASSWHAARVMPQGFSL